MKKENIVLMSMVKGVPLYYIGTDSYIYYDAEDQCIYVGDYYFEQGEANGAVALERVVLEALEDKEVGVI